MKKFLAVLLCLGLVAGMVGALLAGCGGNPHGGELVKLAQESLDRSNSYRFQGTKEVTLKSVDGSEDTSQTANLVGELQKANDTINQHIVYDLSGATIEYYMMGTMTYLNMAGAWYYSDTGALSEPGDTTGFSKQELSRMLLHAESIKVDSEDDNSATFNFMVGKGYMDELEAQLRADAERNGTPQEELDASLQILANLKIKITLTYNKQTQQIDKVTRITDYGDIQGQGELIITDDLVLSDFDAPINIVLPAEAQNAQPLNSLSQ